MIDIEDALKSATAGITQPYFQTQFDGDANGKRRYRERIYAYELYHQLRLFEWNGEQGLLHGEMDKSGHRKISSQAKPDLIVHVPGKSLNFAVIEIKHTDSGKAGIQKDLCTLGTFVRSAGYKNAVLLVFGDDWGKFERRLRSATQSHPVNCSIQVWSHDEIGKSAHRMCRVSGNQLDFSK